jgi:hypothetical protein
MERDSGRTDQLLGLAACCLLLGSSGCGAEPHEILFEQAPIVNGTPETGYPEVGVVTSGMGSCTGTLVGVKTVLTAGHCVFPGASYKFVTEGESWYARATRRHPGYTKEPVSNDVALLLLYEQPPVRPASISTRPPAEGQRLTLVGYGITGYGLSDSGTKRSGTNTVASLWDTQIEIIGASGDLSNICSGDSGGPSFAVIDGHEVQVGVHSTGMGCSRAFDMRADVFIDWLEQAAEQDLSLDGEPSPFADLEPPEVALTSPAEGTEARGVVDVVAAAKDNDRVLRVALSIDGGQEDALTEEPFAWTLRDLEPGEHTLTVAAYDQSLNRSEATRRVTILPPWPFGEPCTRDGQCESQVCAEHPAERFCSVTCEVDEDCPERSTCSWHGERQACTQPVPPQGGCSAGARARPHDALSLFGLVVVLSAWRLRHFLGVSPRLPGLLRETGVNPTPRGLRAQLPRRRRSGWVAIAAASTWMQQLPVRGDKRHHNRIKRR